MSVYNPPPYPPVPAGEHKRFFHDRRRRGRSLVLVAEPVLGAVAHPDNLAVAFDLLKAHNGRAPGPDGVRYPDLGRGELFGVLRPVSEAILGDTYRPAPGRRIPIPKAGGGGVRTLTLRNVVDRAVAKALHEALVGTWEGVFHDHSHGFRPGRSPLTLLARLERVMVAEDRWVLVADDVRQAFDSVAVNAVLDHHRDHLLNNALLDRLVVPVLRGGEPDRTKGIDQACPYSPTALNVHLHHVFDRPAHAPGVKPGSLTPWYRYADNVVAPARDVQEGQEALHQAASLLGAAGLALKGENGGQPVDLRRGGRSSSWASPSSARAAGSATSCRPRPGRLWKRAFAKPMRRPAPTPTLWRC